MVMMAPHPIRSSLDLNIQLTCFMPPGIGLQPDPEADLFDDDALCGPPAWLVSRLGADNEPCGVVEKPDRNISLRHAWHLAGPNFTHWHYFGTEGGEAARK